MKWRSALIGWLLAACLSPAARTQPAELSSAARRRLDLYGGFIHYFTPEMDRVQVATVPYRPGRFMDIYYPPDFDFQGRCPVVVFVFGYSDRQACEWFGAGKLKETGQYASWAEAVAVAGLVGVTYEVAYADDDIHSLLDFLVERGAAMGLDATRIGLWSCSGNAPTALLALTDKHHEYRRYLRCAVLYYPVLNSYLNLAVPFIPPALRNEPRPDVPLLLVKVGEESPVLNEAVDVFRDLVREAGAPVEILYYGAGVHGFDTLLDTERTRQIIGRTLEFLASHLGR